MRALYVVFSATSSKMGKWIRYMTGGRYNHVSVSLDPKLEHLYSFARIYRNTPFYGGFVCESFRRYDTTSEIRVCRIPLSEKQYRFFICYIRRMRQKQKTYLYNLFSAGMVPLHIRVNIRGCYTCVEFTCDLLAAAGFPLIYGGFYTIEELCFLLADYTVYEGLSADYPAHLSWKGDKFPVKQNIIDCTRKTAGSMMQLTGRALLELYEHILARKGHD